MTAVLILAGGPSAASIDLDRSKFPEVIAVNRSWEIAPWAKTLFFGDPRWWLAEHGGEPGFGFGDKVLQEFNGEIVSSAVLPQPRSDRIKFVRVTDDPKLIGHKDYVFGADSGTKAISMALNRGWKRIMLAGFDLAPAPDGATHWHEEYPEVCNYAEQWRTCFASRQKLLYEAAKARGVDIWRITEPGHKDIPYRPL